MSARQRQWRTPQQEARNIVSLLIENYFDVGQPEADYDPQSDIRRDDLEGGLRRAGAVKRALRAIQQRMAK